MESKINNLKKYIDLLHKINAQLLYFSFSHPEEKLTAEEETERLNNGEIQFLNIPEVEEISQNMDSPISDLILIFENTSDVEKQLDIFRMFKSGLYAAYKFYHDQINIRVETAGILGVMDDEYHFLLHDIRLLEDKLGLDDPYPFGEFTSVKCERLKQKEIALYLWYSEEAVTMDNMNEIAARFGYTSPRSGHAIKQDYDSFQHRQNRIGNSGNSKSNKSRREYFERIIPMLKHVPEQHEKAKAEFEIFLSNTYQSI